MSMEIEKDKYLPRPPFEDVFKAFDECDLNDFVIEREHSLPREIDLDWDNEHFERFMEFIGKWQGANSLREAQQEQATTTADSSASLRNDKQKGKNKSKG